jgi:magnesium transporter
MSLIENICLCPQHTGEIYTVLEYNSRGVFIHMIFQGGIKMKIYKITGEEFALIPKEEAWFEIGSSYFITCESREMTELMPVFNFDSSTVEECLSVDQNIKLESFDGYDFTTFNHTTLQGGGLKSFEVNIYASRSYIVLVYDRNLKSLSTLEEDIIARRPNLLQKPGNFLNKVYYLILDRIIQDYFKTLEYLEDNIEEIESDIVLNGTRKQLDRIMQVKSVINYIRKYINPMVYIGDALLLNDNEVIHKTMMKYFTSLDLRINKLNDFSISLRHLINEARNAYDSKVSLKTNDKATLITMIAAFFAPFTVIAGIYGMNFDHMPELNWAYGYPFAIFLMFTVSGAMYAFLKYKKLL